jgi:hypothetical protein
MTNIIDPNQNYTFSKIFELRLEIDDLVVELGYSLNRVFLDLPQYHGKLDRLEILQ